jgi:hypothetical protein
MQIRFTAVVTNPIFSVTLHNSAGIPLLSVSSGWGSEPAGDFQAGERVRWAASFDNVLGPDRYTLTPSVTLGGGAVLALRERMSTVVVTRSAPTGAMVDIPFDQQLQRDLPLDVEDELIR